MARRRGPLLLMISLLLAVFAAWIANNWIKARASSTPVVAMEHVVIAAMDIPLGTKIEQRHLSMIDTLAGKAPSGSFRDYAGVIGKVTSSTVIAGELLLAPRLADSQTGSALAAVVATNMRAVTVRVDDVVGVAGFLLPGNHVDVIETEHDSLGNKVRAQTILSNVKVLAVDQTAAPDSSQPMVVRAVTLEVTPADAETLLKGKTAGSIQLALRNPLDESDTRTKPVEEPRPPVKVAYVRVPVLVRPKPGPEITAIRGTEISYGPAVQRRDEN
jgi:pilus assembly protein CpaB